MRRPAAPALCARKRGSPCGLASPLSLAERDLDLDFGAAAGLGADLEGSLFQLGALAHREQAQVLVLVQVRLGAATSKPRPSSLTTTEARDGWGVLVTSAILPRTCLWP